MINCVWFSMTVGLRKWLSQSVANLRDNKKTVLSKLFRPLYYVYVSFFLTITKRWPYGTNVFDKDWDVLIILDACRVDALEEVSDEYQFISVDDSITSVGSTSFEWMNYTFHNRNIGEIKHTAHVTGNGYTDRVLNENGHTGNAAMPFGPSNYNTVSHDDFGYIEELWRADFEEPSRWTVGNGTTRTHPRYTTERAISAGRERDSERLIVHYMYPHDPFPLADDPDLLRPFDALRAGTISRDEAWNEYLDHLRFVLDEVELLLENMDANDVVITADHGEAFGEYGFYRHVIGCPIPCMREVPWVTTSAEDKGTCIPKAPEPETETESVSVENRLEDLGYL